MAKHRPYPDFIPNSILAYSKEAQDQMHHEQQVWREEQMLLYQQEQTEWLKEVEKQNQLQRIIDRKSDRKFLWIVTLTSAIIGSIVTILYEAFFK